ncbi:MAG: AAA family ATPase [Desulfobacterales bacterium]|jgi:type II secretory pathway predicted ATPase ExeA
MYLEHWGLQKKPFGNVPSRDVFYRSPQHEEALRRLLYAIEHRKGVAMLTGEVGCGKTTVTKALSNHLGRDQFQFEILSNPALQPTDLIKAILLRLGDSSSDNGSKTVLLDRLQKLLVQNGEQGICTVLAIDEAHVISNQATLDELRMLLNIQSEDEFLITMVLLGQPPLLKNISDLQPLKERISIKFNLEPLDVENTLRYVVFRLKNAGASRGIFTREAIETLYEYSCGIPLRINNVCDRCLLIGLMKKAQVVDSKVVEDAIQDLNS